MAHEGQEEEVDFSALIPELSTWNEGKGLNVDSWLTRIGSYEHAVAYARLFWPAFTIHEDCVLFAGFSEKIFGGFMEQTGGNKQAVEAVMNHRHILDLFQNVSREPTEEVLLHLGRMLKDMWSCKLRRDFPSRTVLVTFPEEGIDDLSDYEITFFQEHQRAG
jgi:hypothetical protein